ncbi:MAG TPA: hypothetical protein VJM48_07545 [Methylibium sp.]|nr:hypothetical protein [Methylibium sp.]
MKRATGVAWLLAGIATGADAGRPLATDDAATVGEGQCQLEAWIESPRRGHGLVAAPACGLTASAELGVELARSRVAGQTAESATLAAKWVAGELGWTDWALGAKVYAGRSRERPGPWQADERGALLLASRSLAPQWAVHANLGIAHRPGAGRSDALAKLATVWQPAPAFLAFAEIEAQQRAATTQSAGLRWWLVPERLGMDFTASRDVGVPDSRRVTVGFGWYGVFGE